MEDRKWLLPLALSASIFLLSGLVSTVWLLATLRSEVTQIRLRIENIERFIILDVER